MVKDIKLSYKYDVFQNKIDKKSKLFEIEMENIRHIFCSGHRSLLLIESNQKIYGTYSHWPDEEKSFLIETRWDTENKDKIKKVLVLEDGSYDDDAYTNNPFYPYPIRSFPFGHERYGEFDTHVLGVWLVITKIELWSIPAPT